MVNHACNLSCSYCYTGKKFQRSMPCRIGRRAIERAVASLCPSGTLELGFFGGEPLIEAESISEWIKDARELGETHSAKSSFGLTTNGTLRDEKARDLLFHPDLDIAISHDGLPEVHDAHRRDRKGRRTSWIVEQTIRDLLDSGKEFRVVMVVRPDTVCRLTEGIVYLRRIGVSAIDLTLDVWADWNESQMASLDMELRSLARIWREELRDLRINWFDEKLAALFPNQVCRSTRCGFGQGEIAVAPSGNLYPCERLIGEDHESNRMRLSGHVLEGEDFLRITTRPLLQHEGCSSCLIQECCNTTCRCNNYVRTGDPNRPDRLLCALNKVCLEEASKALSHATVLEKVQ